MTQSLLLSLTNVASPNANENRYNFANLDIFMPIQAVQQVT